MLATGFRPDDVALVSVLSCCAQLGALDRGRTIHEYIRRNRARRLSVYLWTGLVDMYAKCGCVGSAVEVFEASSTKSLLTWNAIVVGVAMHGHGDLAMGYFERMKEEGVSPDGISFLGVLVGCSHTGMVDTAKSLFEEMERVYGVERELKHYGCMADLTHGSVEVAEIAMKRLLEIDGEDSGVYSIMMDVYSAASRWEDVERMRRLINEAKMKKRVACSLIEP
ncbi:uncharacterized protein A4U43_C09F15170 [Asparagus officinalis]|uniref:Pentatricopeptide repeat-containing protein n=1 Tax=Asparagus officinalis TaxID=4686 RepID=A0A5P1E7V4_ASPOF|nr:uncharacterized protein A4U43_C09F15170 [Asparagus officinalis]